MTKRFVERRVIVSDLNSAGYYRFREAKERELAQAAKNEAIQAIHLEMAARYSRLVLKAPRISRFVD